MQSAIYSFTGYLLSAFYVVDPAPALGIQQGANYVVPALTELTFQWWAGGGGRLAINTDMLGSSKGFKEN